MNSSLLKRLFSAIQKGVDTDVTALCQRVVDDERRRGHMVLAKELEGIVGGMAARQIAPSSLIALPTSRRDSAPLVQVLSHESLRHYMILPPEVESCFMRVEKEYAARTRLAKHGLKARTRVLLSGPPGCGKSLGAERLAWATGLPMHRVRFDTLISSYFGETANNLQRVFEDAARRPCVLFLDECDTIARSRRETNDVGEVPRIVNMLLQLLEEFRGDGLVIAATNLYDALDNAIYRRFDEVISIPMPTAAEIQKLLKMALDALPVQPKIDWESFAQDLRGQSCSEVVKSAQNAAKRSILGNRAFVSEADLSAAIAELKRSQ